ncbi:protein kinase domain-containing protein [Streptomyces nigra]|uniref:protein kinase domain-containing protein n=1 Tax=Streptomyces nigra TaxID=1827580 RepID=UPI0036B84D1B
MNPRDRGPRLPVGFQVGGWALGAVIGSGGRSIVYEARSVPGGAPAAVKVVSTPDDLVEREVWFGTRADHPHLLRTRAVRRIDAPEPAGAVALVMDRADVSLRHALAAGVPGLDPVRLLQGIAAGLAHLHGLGWVHGDVTAANVLLGPRDGVRLADFGLTSEPGGVYARTPPLGTLDHRPPEWWSARRRADGTVLRTTADIWAFGVLAHQVLTGGHHPFPGLHARARALAAQAYARGNAPLRLHPSLDEGRHRLIADCLARDHASRLPRTAASLVARIGDGWT